MAFTDQLVAADALILSKFGSSQLLTLRLPTGVTYASVPAVTQNPTLLEDYVPGSTTGTTVLFLFIRPTSDADLPRNGFQATYGGVDYDIFRVDVDREGGASLRLRRRANAAGSA